MLRHSDNYLIAKEQIDRAYKNMLEREMDSGLPLTSGKLSKEILVIITGQEYYAPGIITEDEYDDLSNYIRALND